MKTIARFVSPLFSVMSAVTLAFGAWAESRTFVGDAGGAWGTAANWDPSGVPAAADTAVVPVGKSVSVTAADVANFLAVGNVTLNGTVDLVDVTATLSTPQLSGTGTFRALGTSATKRTVTFDSDNSDFQGTFIVSNVSAVVKSPAAIGSQLRDEGANASVVFYAASLKCTFGLTGAGDYYGKVTTTTASWYDFEAGVSGGLIRLYGEIEFKSNSHLKVTKGTVEQHGTLRGLQIAVIMADKATFRCLGPVVATRLFSDSTVGTVEFGTGLDFSELPYFDYYGLNPSVPCTRFLAPNLFADWTGYYRIGSSTAPTAESPTRYRWTTDLNGHNQTVKYICVNGNTWQVPTHTNILTSAAGPATLTVTGNLGQDDNTEYGTTFDWNGHLSLELNLPAAARVQTLRSLEGRASETDGALLITRAEVKPTTFRAPNLSKIQVGNDFGDDAKTAQLTIAADYENGINPQTELVVKPHGTVSIAADKTLTVRTVLRPNGVSLRAGTYRAADIADGWLAGAGSLVVLQDGPVLDTDYVWAGIAGKGVADADAWLVDGVVPMTAPGAGATVVVRDGKSLTIGTAADVAFVAALYEAKVLGAGRLVFTQQTTALGASVKLSGDGTLVFATDSDEEFTAAYDGLGLTGDILITNTHFRVNGSRVFGSAKVTNYIADKGRISFRANASGTYANDFDLHASSIGKWVSSLRTEGNTYVTLTGKVRTWGHNTTCFVESMDENSVLAFEGDLCPQQGYLHCRTRNKASDTVRLGNGDAAKVFDFGGCILTGDMNAGTNVFASSLQNVLVTMNKGVRWRLEVDDPIQSSESVKSIVSKWETEGGWFDLNGHHLIAGSKTANRWLENVMWKDLNQPATPVKAGGFYNYAPTRATFQIRQMFGGISDTSPIRYEMNGNLNVEWDGHFAAWKGSGDNNDDNGSWSCWLGNYADKTSTLWGDLIATRGALHLASSANYPNVRRLVAKTNGAIFIENGATVNADVALAVEGGGLVYVAHDTTVANVYKDGVRVAPGSYTTGDFTYLKPRDGTSVYNITITGGGEVAQVGSSLYGSVDEAIDAAGGTGTITLLADADCTRTGTFRVNLNGHVLTPAGTLFVRTTTAGDVTTYVTSDTPTFSGGAGTAADPYQVANANDLFELAHWVGVNRKFAGVCFRQTADIAWTAADGAFPGIGVYDGNIDGLASFAGEYDGNGRTISNIVFADRTYAGLFNQIAGGTLKNLTMNNASFVGTAASSGGAFFAGNLRNGAKLVGLTAKGAFGTAAKPVPHTAAGIACHASDCRILSCTNEAAIVGAGSKVAGILGITQNQSDAGEVLIADCANTGSISQKNNTTQNGGVAGILGYGWHDTVYGAGGIVIRGCTSTGAVSSTFATCHLGSVVGYAYGDIPIVCSDLTVRADVRTVGAVRVAGGCTGAAYATVAGAVATVVTPTATLSGENRWKLMCDAADAFALTDDDGVLDFDATLGTDFTGMVTHQGQALKKRLRSGHILYLVRNPGLTVIVR